MSRDATTHPDVHDERTHPCGCRTYFDVARWLSVTVVACERHARIRRATAEVSR